MSRLPVVALHGFMGSPDTFRGLVDGMSRPVLARELPVPDPFVDDALSDAHDRVARCLLDSLETEGVSRFHLLGYSLGGRIAMHMARQAPERVDHVILESAHPGLDDPREREARRNHDAEWAKRIRTGWPDVLDAWYDQGVFASLPSELRTRLRSEKMARDPEFMARTLESLSLGRQRPLWEDLARSASPILFVSGEMDDRYRGIGERLAAQSGPIRHQTLPGAGHVVHREQPEAYLAALESFLSLESSPQR